MIAGIRCARALVRSLVAIASLDVPTVGDLLQLANDVLGGENPGSLNLVDLTEALKSINNGFDKCRILDEFFSTPQNSVIAINPELPIVIFNEGYDFTLWPNPTSGEVILSLNKTPESDLTVEVFDHVGRLVRVDRMTDVRQTYDLGN